MGQEGLVTWLGSAIGFVMSLILGLGTAAVVAAMFLAVAQSTASGEDEIHHWPTLQFTDWIGEVLFVVNSVALSGLPGFLIGMLVGLLFQSSTITGICCGVTIYAGFPFFFFSTTESNSPFAFVSKTAVESLRYSWSRWRSFYIRSFAMGAIPFLMFLLTNTDSILLNAFVAAVVMLALTIYARLVGRLIWCCAEDEAERINAQSAD